MGCAVALICFATQTSYALSREIGRDIEFPEGYDAVKKKAILAVVQDERFRFAGGIVSYWPPDWATRLSFSGDAKSLTEFLRALRGVSGVGFRLVFYKGQDTELRRDSTWQLEFSKAHPDLLTVYANLNRPELELDKVQLPKWH